VINGTLRALAALAALGVLAGCSEDREPIVVAQNAVTVENQSSSEWTGVEIWVNDHYRVTAPSMAARQRLVVPLSTFVAGYGQRFDRARASVFGVEVTAKTSDGEAVRLIWGKGRRR
jgi:hypothetical protein